MGLFRG